MEWKNQVVRKLVFSASVEIRNSTQNSQFFTLWQFFLRRGVMPPINCIEKNGKKGAADVEAMFVDVTLANSSSMRWKVGGGLRWEMKGCLLKWQGFLSAVLTTWLLSQVWQADPARGTLSWYFSSPPSIDQFSSFTLPLLWKWCESKQNTQHKLQSNAIQIYSAVIGRSFLKTSHLSIQIRLCCLKNVAGMAYKPRGPPEVDKNRQKPRRVGLCEKYHRFDQQKMWQCLPKKCLQASKLR